MISNRVWSVKSAELVEGDQSRASRWARSVGLTAEIRPFGVVLLDALLWRQDLIGDVVCTANRMKFISLERTPRSGRT